MTYTEIEDIFLQNGGKFFTSSYSIQERLQDIKAYVFDWDGVFNSARKGLDESSDFSERDTMGISMLRYAHFLMHKENPLMAVINEELTPVGKSWSKREYFDAVYEEARDKKQTLKHFCRDKGISPKNVVYFYDDILDWPIAREVGIRFAVNIKDSPAFRQFIRFNKLVDYQSGSMGHEHAVRELCELVIMLYGKHVEVINRRGVYDESYLNFVSILKQTTTKIYSCRDDKIILTN